MELSEVGISASEKEKAPTRDRNGASGGVKVPRGERKSAFG